MMMKQIRDRNLYGLFLISLTALVAVFYYLWTSYQKIGFGFPLDDAWIHQTYARNLIEYGEWSFIPGKPSAGSTAPLWTGLISLGLWIGMDPKIWSYSLGGIFLIGLGWLSSKWFSERWGESPRWIWWVGAAVCLEWHILWASLSGMETLAFSVICVWVFILLERESFSALLVGSLIGAGVWIRPGALTLLLPVILGLLFNRKMDRARSFFQIVLGFSITFGPYLFLNSWLTGSIWPNTFYAKQAEYLELNQFPLLLRFLQQVVQPLIGVGCLLLPGIFLGLVRHGRNQNWIRLLPLFWVLTYLGMYAVRLPVTYQHGRYAIPTIPILMVLGIEGLSRWTDPGSSKSSKRFFSRLWILSTLGVLFAFTFVGASAYTNDVAIIETEMVAAAHWLEENTEEHALIAAHDIGALGYFCRRDLLDLAGLISPEVIPFIRDQEKLAEYLDHQDADYLMTFPEWYPELVRERKLLYITRGEFSLAAGGENMAVYRWGD
jgi:hypothetical protein